MHASQVLLSLTSNVDEKRLSKWRQRLQKFWYEYDAGEPGTLWPGCRIVCYHLLTWWSLPVWSLCPWTGKLDWGRELGGFLSLGIRSCLSKFWTRSQVIQGCLGKCTPDPKSLRLGRRDIYSGSMSNVKTVKVSVLSYLPPIPQHLTQCLAQSRWLSSIHSVNKWKVPPTPPVKLFYL